MRTVLLSPAYRGRITAAGPSEAQVRVRLNLADYDLKPEDLRLEARVRDAAGAKVWESTSRAGAPHSPLLDLAVPVRGFPAGRYDLRFNCLGRRARSCRPPTIR